MRENEKKKNDRWNATDWSFIVVHVVVTATPLSTVGLCIAKIKHIFALLRAFERIFDLYEFLFERKKNVWHNQLPMGTSDERWTERERERKRSIYREWIALPLLQNFPIAVNCAHLICWNGGMGFWSKLCNDTTTTATTQRVREINIIKLLGLPDSDYVQSTVISEMRKMCFNSNFAFFFSFHLFIPHIRWLYGCVCVCCAVVRIFVLHRWCISCHCIIQQRAKKFNQFVLTVQHSLTHTHVCVAKMLTYRCCACYCREKERGRRGRQGLYTYITRVCFLILITTHTHDTPRTHIRQSRKRSPSNKRAYAYSIKIRKFYYCKAIDGHSTESESQREREREQREV